MLNVLYILLIIISLTFSFRFLPIPSRSIVLSSVAAPMQRASFSDAPMSLIRDGSQHESFKTFEHVETFDV